MRLSITRTSTLALSIGAAALVLAACGGGNSSNSSSASTAPASKSGGVVSTADVNGKTVLVDAQGRTVYSASVEKGGKVHCTGMCTTIWKPVDATAKQAKTAAAKLNMSFGDITRPDGATQLTLDGLPVYTFTQEGPRSLDGNGFVDDFNGTHFEWATAGSGGTTASSSMGSGGSSNKSNPYGY